MPADAGPQANRARPRRPYRELTSVGGVLGPARRLFRDGHARPGRAPAVARADDLPPPLQPARPGAAPARSPTRCRSRARRALPAARHRGNRLHAAPEIARWNTPPTTCPADARRKRWPARSASQPHRPLRRPLRRGAGTSRPRMLERGTRPSRTSRPTSPRAVQARPRRGVHGAHARRADARVPDAVRAHAGDRPRDRPRGSSPWACATSVCKAWPRATSRSCAPMRASSTDDAPPPSPCHAGNPRASGPNWPRPRGRRLARRCPFSGSAIPRICPGACRTDRRAGRGARDHGRGTLPVLALPMPGRGCPERRRPRHAPQVVAAIERGTALVRPARLRRCAPCPSTSRP